MPPSRRKSANPASAGAHSQSTLSFNNKPSRITKPAVTSHLWSKKEAKLDEKTEAQIDDVVPLKDEGQITAEPEKAEAEPEAEAEEEREEASEFNLQKPQLKPTPKPQEEEEASPATLSAQNVTDAQIKKYWAHLESLRIAPRVHQQHLSTHEKILRHFDLSSQYGPCIGIPRLRRWKRAEMLGLGPPVEVLAVLMREEKKATGSGRMAYIDELAGGRPIAGVVE